MPDTAEETLKLVDEIKRSVEEAIAMAWEDPPPEKAPEPKPDQG